MTETFKVLQFTGMDNFEFEKNKAAAFANTYNNWYELENPIHALDRYQELYNMGSEALNAYPDKIKIIRSVASATPDQINVWANNQLIGLKYSGEMNKQTDFLFFVKKAENFVNDCRGILKMPKTKPIKN